MRLQLRDGTSWYIFQVKSTYQVLGLCIQQFCKHSIEILSKSEFDRKTIGTNTNFEICIYFSTILSTLTIANLLLY